MAVLRWISLLKLEKATSINATNRQGNERRNSYLSVLSIKIYSIPPLRQKRDFRYVCVLRMEQDWQESVLYSIAMS